MARIVISDPNSGKSYQVEAEDSQFQNLIGKKIGENFDGDLLDLPGYKLKITGGSDGEGFPMRRDVKGEGRTRPLLKGGTGYQPKEEGLQRRKTIRGNTVSSQIIQLNTSITEHGEKSLEEVLGKETGEEPAE
ncbi:MAG: 30S ribosomal protein S6e [Candidatus Hadarchaeia archaeon]